jgi:hypothetical protein
MSCNVYILYRDGTSVSCILQRPPGIAYFLVHSSKITKLMAYCAVCTYARHTLYAEALPCHTMRSCGTPAVVVLQD